MNAGSVKVAVVGADTHDTPSLVSPDGVTGLDVPDPVTSVNSAIDELKTKKAAGELDYDVIAVEYHEGSASSADAGQNPGGGDLFDRIVNETSADADVIFNGHTHQTYSFEAPVPGEADETRPVMQTGSYGTNLGKVMLTVDASGDWDAVADQTGLAATSSADLNGACASDATYQAAAAISDSAKAAGAVAAAQQVGSISEDLTTAWAPSRAAYSADGTWEATTTPTSSDRGDDRASTSTLSNALADSKVWATQQDSYAGTKATIGVMNPGGVRADLFYTRSGAETADGQVTYGEANNVVPFVNNLSTVDLTGAQFIKLLNQQWQRDANGQVPSRPYLALGLSDNVQYTFDASKLEGERITSVTIDGAPIDENATYTVVAANFLTAGGDNFRAFAEGTNVTDTGLLDRDAWIDYLAAHPNLAPDYSQRGVGVQVTNPDAAGTSADPFTVHVTKLESRSLGAPRIDAVTISVAGNTYTAPYTQGSDGTWSADVQVALPGGTPADSAPALRLVLGQVQQPGALVPRRPAPAPQVPGADERVAARHPAEAAVGPAPEHRHHLLAFAPRLDLEGPGVPDRHGPGAVLALGDGPLEGPVPVVVVLGLHGQAAATARERQPLGHSPRGEHPVVLEPEIPVQVGGVVLVDDEHGLRRRGGHDPGSPSVLSPPARRASRSSASSALRPSGNASGIVVTGAITTSSTTGSTSRSSRCRAVRRSRVAAWPSTGMTNISACSTCPSSRTRARALRAHGWAEAVSSSWETTGCTAESSYVRARTSVRPAIALRTLRTPSWMIPPDTKIAAAASAHHQPRPMPSTPTMVARPDCQSALFMSASAYRTLSWTGSATFILARPSSTAGIDVTTMTRIMGQPAQIPCPAITVRPMGARSPWMRPSAESMSR